MKLKLLFSLLLTASLSASFAQSKLVENHSISTNFISILYSYEHPIGREVAMNYSAAIASNIIITDRAGYFSLMPYVAVEPRFYYNLDKRAAKNKNTYKNSANYFALKARVLLPSFYSNDQAMGSSTEFQIAPVWGIKRVYGQHFVLDTHIGLGICAGRNDYYGSIIVPKLFGDIKLGYVF